MNFHLVIGIYSQLYQDGDHELAKLDLPSLDVSKGIAIEYYNIYDITTTETNLAQPKNFITA